MFVHSNAHGFQFLALEEIDISIPTHRNHSTVRLANEWPDVKVPAHARIGHSLRRRRIVGKGTNDGPVQPIAATRITVFAEHDLVADREPMTAFPNEQAIDDDKRYQNDHEQ